MNRKIQCGVIPWVVDDGVKKILLITTRETKRWSIPRGNIMKGKTKRETAEIEAFEECGAIGKAGKKIGEFEYFKRMEKFFILKKVIVFEMKVQKMEVEFLEKGMREFGFFTKEEARKMIDTPSLSVLFDKI